jgi:hypothetical protein
LYYHKSGDLDDRVTILEGQVLDLSELTDGEILQYNESESALVGKSITEMKTLLGWYKGTTAERTALALTLGAGDEGSVYFWDTTLKAQFIWNGTEFV